MFLKMRRRRPYKGFWISNIKEFVTDTAGQSRDFLNLNLLSSFKESLSLSDGSSNSPEATESPGGPRPGARSFSTNVGVWSGPKLREWYTEIFWRGVYKIS